MARITQENKADYQHQKLLELFKEVVPEVVEGIEAPYRLYRYDRGDDRFYYRINSGQVMPYLSVTSFVSKSLPTSPYLIRWVGDLGNDLADHKKYISALYGTILHIELAKVLREMAYDFTKVHETVKNALPIHLLYLLGQWEYELKRDITAFIQFVYDYKVEVIACELPVYSDEFGLGGTIDLVCKMKFNGKTVIAIIDFKSGRKGFWDSHELQLHCYKEIFNDLFGALVEVTHVFNWAPNNWRKKPTYKLQNQSKSIFAESAIYRMPIALIEKWVIPPVNFYDISGVVENIAEFDFNNHQVGDTSVLEALVEH